MSWGRGQFHQLFMNAFISQFSYAKRDSNLKCQYKKSLMQNFCTQKVARSMLVKLTQDCIPLLDRITPRQIAFGFDDRKSIKEFPLPPSYPLFPLVSVYPSWCQCLSRLPSIWLEDSTSSKLATWFSFLSFAFFILLYLPMTGRKTFQIKIIQWERREERNCDQDKILAHENHLDQCFSTTEARPGTGTWRPFHRDLDN